MRVEMTGRAWRQRSLGAALACVLVAAGCTSRGPADAETSSAPSGSATTEPATEPDPSDAADSHPKPRRSAPTLPAAAEGDSVRAAEAFVRHYIELLNYAMTTGDTKAFRAASRDCEGCDRYAELFEEQYDRGGSNKSRGWSVSRLFMTRAPDGLTALVTVKAAKLRYKKSKSARAVVYASSLYSVRLLLEMNNGWRIALLTSSET